MFDDIHVHVAQLYCLSILFDIIPHTVQPSSPPPSSLPPPLHLALLPT